MKKSLAFILALALLLSLGVPALAFTAQLSAQNLSVNGNTVACEKYNIDGSNYFKLRDLAQLLNGTGSQFDVGWDASAGVVSITTNHAYTAPNGTELVVGADQSATAVLSAQTIKINGAVRADLTVYNIGGSNFFKLREMGDALGFEVEYDGNSNTAIVQSKDISVEPEPIVYNGAGDMVLTGINLANGTHKIALSYQGNSNFIVVPYDGNGKRFSSWANEIGNYSGETVFNGELSSGYIEVKATGNWTIAISDVPNGGTSNLKGFGDCVSPYFSIPSGTLVVSMSYTGDSNFIVVVYDNYGKRYSSLANEIGNYSGQVVFNKGDSSRQYCIGVVSKGNWTVDFGLGDAVTVCP